MIGVKGEAGPMQFECRALGSGSTNSSQHGSFMVRLLPIASVDDTNCDLSCRVCGHAPTLNGTLSNYLRILKCGTP